MPASRPVITSITSAAELKRWYWTKKELSLLAAHLDIATSGSKEYLRAHLCSTLDGAAANTVRPLRRKVAPQLLPPVGRETIIPVGQHSSQTLRHFFEKEIGKQFHFDSFMRDYIANNAGKTLGDVIQHWHATRSAASKPQPIASQFEYNTFIRDWFRTHPNTTKDAAIAAWHEYRSQPRA